MPIINVAPINADDAQEASIKAEIAIRAAEGFKIGTHDDYVMVCGKLKGIKGEISKYEARRKAITSPLDIARKSIMDLFRPAMDNFKRAENVTKRDILTYQTDQERIRRENEAKLEREATKTRLAAEAKAKEFAAKGNEKKAEEWLGKAETAVAPVLAPRVEKQEGISTRKVYKFEVVNARILPADYQIPDIKKIRDMVNASKGTLVIPGVKIWTEDALSAGKI